ncbi:hypothetical protein G4425_00110 [Blautia wexlerae]|nr:hypothetical protein [Ruminococcus sp.]MCB6690685.1 hypothetical protein [Blautia wexlerae]NSD27721.1 hypothetical protein [Blautia wexlerae]NSF39558.1 hypothetical protein [Blautia wexlerae]NSF45097.1 hypothetical protein [Blautia wexlerae]
MFEKTDIWKNKEYRSIQGTYLVIFLSFANVKETTFESARKKINQILRDCYRNFDFLLNSSALNEDNTSYFIKASVLNPPYASLLHLPGSG